MSKGRTSLHEILGKEAADRAGSGKLSLEHLPAILGEAMPELPKNAVGRFRLLRSLKQRFGPNFRSLPGVGDLVKQFDGEIQTEVAIQKIRNVKYTRGK